MSGAIPQPGAAQPSVQFVPAPAGQIEVHQPRMISVSEDWLLRVRAAANAGSDFLALASFAFALGTATWISIATCTFKQGYEAIRSGAGVIGWVSPFVTAFFVWKYYDTRGDAKTMIDAKLTEGKSVAPSPERNG